MPGSGSRRNLRAPIIPKEVSMPQVPVQSLSPGRRAGCAVGAMLTTAGLAVALLGAFVQTAAPLWLDSSSPEVTEQLSRCEPLPPRQGREDCLQKLAAALLEDLQRGVQVAERNSALPAR
jgi:hypothetical protein